MKPLDKNGKAYIFEFKVKDSDEIIAVGIPLENIRKHGFAFEGKKVLIGRR